MAGELTVATTDADGGTKFESTMVTDSPNIDTTGDIRIAADDYDTWCETGTTCSRLINDYTAEVKGNGAYGNNGGVIGSFDQVLRQSFDGGTPRWRGHLDWDSGPNVDGFNWIIRCRKSDGAFDSTCGNENPWDPGVIGSIGQRTWIPSETGYRYNSAGLTGSTNKYHDDFYGAFKASGYTTTWSSGTLHTGRWRSCSACKYYQVPWTTTP